MLNRTASLLAAALFVLAAAALMSGCHAHRPRSSRPLADDTYRRRSHLEDDDSAARMESEIFGTNSDDSSERLQEEEESSISLDEAVGGGGGGVEKRRKGPTLSVVNPLEILRQRLMLDLARRKIHENQQQIVANAHFLENIGKRSSSRHHQP